MPIRAGRSPTPACQHCGSDEGGAPLSSSLEGAPREGAPSRATVRPRRARVSLRAGSGPAESARGGAPEGAVSVFARCPRGGPPREIWRAGDLPGAAGGASLRRAREAPRGHVSRRAIPGHGRAHGSAGAAPGRARTPPNQ
eukprot:scaffold605_cov400-Prasinococcus_capsulatus_cf.AAC.18